MKMCFTVVLTCNIYKIVDNTFGLSSVTNNLMLKQSSFIIRYLRCFMINLACILSATMSFDY